MPHIDKKVQKQVQRSTVTFCFYIPSFFEFFTRKFNTQKPSGISECNEESMYARVPNKCTTAY